MVDRELYEAYSRALATLSDAAEAELRRALAEYETLERDRDYVAAAALYHRIVGRFGRVASEVAREFYQRQRDASDLDSDYVAQQAPEIPGRFCAQDATEARAMSSAAAEWLVGKGSHRVMENADFTIGYNARRDPAHPMWAVVPHPGACGFCVMVASNGWFMAKRPVNAQRHSHCRCSVVADFDVDNPALEGYDPDALQDLYARGVDDAGDTLAQWNALSEDERRAYARKGRSAYDVFRTKKVAAAMDERRELDGIEPGVRAMAARDARSPLDPGSAKGFAESIGRCMEIRKRWFLNDVTEERYEEYVGSFLSSIGKSYGMRVRGEYASGPKLYSAVPDGYEIWAATRLGGYDDDVTFLSTDRRRRKGNPDLLLGGRFAEIKTPVRASKISERIHDGCLQCLNRGQQEGVVIISPLRLEDDQESFNRRVDSAAERKRRRGDEFTLFVLGADSSVRTMK